MRSIVVALLVLVPACLITTNEGEPLAEGVRYSCTYQLDRQLLEAEQCGPAGDPRWVIYHFDFRIDPGTNVACNSVPQGLCVYEPDHRGWDELH